MTPRTAAGRALLDNHAHWGEWYEHNWLAAILAIEAEADRSLLLQRALRAFGHDYDIDGKQEWHLVNCSYRKLWPMGIEDDADCAAARAALAATDVRGALAEALMTTVGTHGWIRFDPPDPAGEWLANIDAIIDALAAARRALDEVEG
jgi:hypothetical protein